MLDIILIRLHMVNPINFF